MNWTLHVRLLQSPEASIKSRGSRSQPPSSSQLLKRQTPDSLHSRRPFHHLLLQIGGARSGRLNCSRSCCIRFPSQPRKDTPKSADPRAFAITVAKTYAKGPS
jgi:hypothetical protein